VVVNTLFPTLGSTKYDEVRGGYYLSPTTRRYLSALQFKMSDFGRFLNLLGLDSELSERLASRRSQESANYSLDGSIKPGTYRIVHVKTNKVLQIHDEKKEKLNIWDRQTQATNRPGTGKDHVRVFLVS
jgi:hypothetical protein